MISDSQTRYGSAVAPPAARQGRTRRWRSYQARRSAAAGAGTASDPVSRSVLRSVFSPWARAFRSGRDAFVFREALAPASVMADLLAEARPADKPRSTNLRPLAAVLRETLT